MLRYAVGRGKSDWGRIKQGRVKGVDGEKGGGGLRGSGGVIQRVVIRIDY